MSNLAIAYLALPIGINDAGRFFPDDTAAVVCASALDAMNAAEDLAHRPPYVAAVAYVHLRDIVTGECETEVLRRCGNLVWSHAKQNWIIDPMAD